MVGLWMVPGRMSEAVSQDLPTRHSPAQISSPSRFHQCHRAPTSPPASFQGSSETWVSGDPGGPTCSVQVPLAQTALEVRALSVKAWADSLPARIPGPPAAQALRFRELEGGWASRALLQSTPALHTWPRQRSAERMEGMSAALSA